MMNTPPPIRCAVNDHQLHVMALDEGGHVLVPFRAIVEALGGRVERFHLPLPPPSRIVAGRTYVPIRFVASALGASVEYDARAHLVNVFTHVVSNAVPSLAPSPVPLSGLRPAPDSRVATAYPTISASIPLASGDAIATVHLLLDDVDVTTLASYAGTFITFIPRDGLVVGTHEVRIDGTSTTGAPFDVTWTFETTAAPASPGTMGYPYEEPYPYVRLNVFASQALSGAPISVQMIAPPDGSAFAFICSSPWQYRLYAAPTSTFYNGSLAAPVTTVPISCPVSAFFVDRNGNVTYAPYPAVITILPLATPRPAPLPTTSARPLPVYRRTPTPAPIAPKPIYTRGPITRPTLRPLPRVTSKPAIEPRRTPPPSR